MTGTYITRTRKVYTFEELGHKERQNAIDLCRHDLHETLDEYWIEGGLREVALLAMFDNATESWNTYFDIRDKSYKNSPRIEYSLGYSQGDGVALFGDFPRELVPNWQLPEQVAYVRLSRTNHYYTHYNSFITEFHDEDGNVIAEASPNSVRIWMSESGNYSTFIGYGKNDVTTEAQRSFYDAVSHSDSLIRALCRKLEKVGYEYIDDYTSQDSALETIASSEYPRQYNEDGTLAPREWWSKD